MFDIIFALFAAVMAIWRTVTYFTCYDPATGLFTRSFAHFTLPNAITVVVSVAVIVAVWRTSSRPTHGWTPKENPAGFLLFLSSLMLLLSGLGQVMLIANHKLELSIGNLLICAVLAAMVGVGMQAVAYVNGHTNASGAGTMSLGAVIAVVLCLLTSFISSTEMAVVEQYMYHLLVLCAAALYFLAITRSLFVQAHMGVALWYGRLMLYFALMEYVPRGIYWLTHGDVFAGVVDVLIAVGMALLVLGISRSTSIVYLTDEELERDAQDEDKEEA